MKVKYKKKFLKELSKIPSSIRLKIEFFVFKQLPEADSIHQLGLIEQMKGYPFCFKVRFGSYRIGMKNQDDTIVLEKVLHRKDIYRPFSDGHGPCLGHKAAGKNLPYPHSPEKHTKVFSRIFSPWPIKTPNLIQPWPF